MDGEIDECLGVEGAEGLEDAGDGADAVEGSGAGAAGTPGGTDGAGGAAGMPDGFAAQIAVRDARIAELEAQVTEAARSAEAAEALRGEIAEVRAQAAADRTEFELRLAGARSVKAARALLEEHGGDVGALKEAEPWLFGAAAGGSPAPSGATGLPNAGAATDEGRDVRRWREIAGLGAE